MNKIINILFVFLLSAYGKIQMKDLNIEKDKNAPIVISDIVNDNRVQSGNGLNIPIQSYIDSSITDSGLIHQQTVIAPQMRDGKTLKLKDITKRSSLFKFRFG